jgi:hypothetical protein
MKQQETADQAEPVPLDLGKYPTLRRLAAHNRAHVHERIGQPCEWCDVDRELRALVAEHEKKGFDAGISRARQVISDFANWAFNTAGFDYHPSNVLDRMNEVLLDVWAGLVTGRLRIATSDTKEGERAR